MIVAVQLSPLKTSGRYLGSLSSMPDLKETGSRRNYNLHENAFLSQKVLNHVSFFKNDTSGEKEKKTCSGWYFLKNLSLVWRHFMAWIKDVFNVFYAMLVRNRHLCIALEILIIIIVMFNKVEKTCRCKICCTCDRPVRKLSG